MRCFDFGPVAIRLNIYSNLGSHSFWKAYLLGPIVTNSKSIFDVPKTALLSNLDISFSKSSSLSYVFSALKSIQVFNQAPC